jgi:hypothetical protein
MPQTGPVSLFMSYAPEDELFCQELEKHLSLLQRQGLISTWQNRRIAAGTDRAQEIDEQFERALIILLLISADFLASNYCYSQEMTRAMARHAAGEVIVIPIILRSVDWKQAPLSKLQALPRDGRPVTMWDQPDEALKQIVTEIRTVVEALLRPIVVVSLPQLQTVAACLVTFLEAHGFPTWYTEYEPKTTELQEALREASAVVLLASSETCSASLLKEAQNLAALYQRPVSTVWVEGLDQSKEQKDRSAAGDISISVNLEAERQEEIFQALLSRVNRLRHSSAFPTVDST